jgi:hypothetical protein
MRTSLKYAGSGILAILVHCGVFLVAIGTAEAQGDSAGEIIRFLTYQTGRPGKLAAEMGLFGCGGGADDRAAEASLVRLGDTAVPDLESALGSLEQSGQSSAFALNGGRLPLAYAKIKGGSARERLLELDRRPQLAFLRPSLHDALSISLSLTSYVSSSTPPEKNFLCRDGQPRDALDQVILAWLRNDRPWLEASLSARSKTALDALEKRGGWSKMRTQLRQTRPNNGVALGYRFSADPSWSLPDDIFEEDESKDRVAQHPENPVIETVFVSATGGECGRRRMKFASTRDDLGSQKITYLVDETDIEGLLRLLSSCTASN